MRSKLQQRLSASAILAGALLAGPKAHAQDPYQQPGYGTPPPGYGTPPPGGYVPEPPMYDRDLERERRRYEKERLKEHRRMINAWRPGDPIPPGYHPEDKPITGLVIGGGVTLGTLWFISAIAGITLGLSGDSGYGPLAIPVAGPFIVMRTGGDRVWAPLHAVNGALQIAGAAMLACGLLFTRPKLVPDANRTFLLPTPMSVGGGHGIGLVGQF